MLEQQLFDMEKSLDEPTPPAPDPEPERITKGPSKAELMARMKELRSEVQQSYLPYQQFAQNNLNGGYGAKKELIETPPNGPEDPTAPDDPQEEEIGSPIMLNMVMIDFKFDGPPLSWRLSQQDKQQLEHSWIRWQKDSTLDFAGAPDETTTVAAAEPEPEASAPESPIEIFETNDEQLSPSRKVLDNAFELKR